MCVDISQLPVLKNVVQSLFKPTITLRLPVQTLYWNLYFLGLFEITDIAYVVDNSVF